MWIVVGGCFVVLVCRMFRLGGKYMARSQKMPTSREITRRVKLLGARAKQDYFDLRDKYKREGLTPKEAYQRAVIELKILERYADWRARKTTQELLGRQVQLTHAEMAEVMPGYEAPSVTKAESVGSEEMTLAEQVKWAKQWAARVQNGEEAPKDFPNEGALFWLQSALSNRREFEKVVLRVEQGSVDGDNEYLRDGQYQVKEIEGQVHEALKEVADRLVEEELGFAELFRGHSESI